MIVMGSPKMRIEADCDVVALSRENGAAAARFLVLPARTAEDYARNAQPCFPWWGIMGANTTFQPSLSGMIPLQTVSVLVDPSTSVTPFRALMRARERTLSRMMCVVAFAAALGGCRDDSVTSYRIPKEKEAPRREAAHSPHGAAMPAGGDMSGAAVASAAGAELVWTAPAHWRTKAASSVRKGSYTVGDEGGPTADMAVTAFPGDVGGDLANVNRWLSQIQMPPIGAGELARVMSHHDFNGLHMNVVELTNGDGAFALRMLSAIVPFDGATWFFKLTGPNELVAREKPAFVAFLGTIKPSTGAAAPTAHPAHPETSTTN